MKNIGLKGLLVLILLPILCPGLGYAESPPSLFKAVTIDTADMRLEATPVVVRQRFTGIDFDLLLNPSALKKGESLDLSAAALPADQDKPVQINRFMLDLFDDVSYMLVIERVENMSPDGSTVTWFGHIEGVPNSEVIIVTSDKIMSGNIALPGGFFYQIRYAGNNTHAIREIDQSAFPQEAPPVEVELPDDTSSDKSDRTSSEPDGEGDPTERDEVSYIIDVMVVYTPAARTAVGGTTAMNTLIDLAVSETNQGYINSQITQRINLVHRAEVSYTETSSNAFENALAALQHDFDGEMDVVHPWRDYYKADMVSLFIHDNEYCGLAFVMLTESHDFEEFAFSVVAWDCATGDYSFAHEMGHNQGGMHDMANSPEDGVFAYSHGFQDPDGDFRTIMAYNCPGDCARVNYWSNTVVTYSGDPLGDAVTADMRRSHNNTYDTVSNWRVRVTTVYVDGSWTGYENGTSSYPFNTISEGVNAITPATVNGHLYVKPINYTGSGNVPITVDKSITLHNWGTGSIIIR